MRGGLFAEPKVRPILVVAVNVLAKEAAQMCLVPHDHMV